MEFLTQGSWALEGVQGASYIGWIFLSEFLGSFLLILIGNGVVAATNLNGSKAKGGGWTAIVLGWSFAVFVGAICAQYSQANLNFAVTIAVLVQSLAGKSNMFSQGHEWLIVIYLVAQFSGMFIAQLVVDAMYWLQIKKTKDAGIILAIHCTSPANVKRTKKTYALNVFAEFMGTFVLIIGISAAAFYVNKDSGAGSFALEPSALAAVAIAAVVVGAVGYGLGGPTGFAINPTRDLAPRIVHQILPLPNKGSSSDWAYSWVPIVGPLLGATAAAGVTIGLIM